METTFLGIIPARWASTRFPGKPLAEVGGKAMILRVVERASEALGADNVIVATDDRRILEAVAAAGGRAVMTSPDHPSGTDRCLEAYRLSGSDADVVVNIQGDEPFIATEQITTLCGCFNVPGVNIATLVRPYEGPYEGLANPNKPKVVVDDNGNALWFSRSVIPYVRGAEPEKWPSLTKYYTHVGLYAYRATTLDVLTSLPRSSAEIAESLEQLRWLQNGFRIKTAVTTLPTIGIDTPDDLRRAEEYLREQGL